jgi:hypothetical protein
MKVQQFPSTSPATPKGLSTPPQGPEGPEEPKEKFVPSPRRESPYAAKNLIPRMMIGAAEGFLAHQYGGGNFGTAVAIGAGTGFVAHGLIEGVKTAKAAKVDGLPEVGFLLGSVWGGGMGAGGGAVVGGLATLAATYTGTGPAGAAIAGALLSVVRPSI